MLTVPFAEFLNLFEQRATVENEEPPLKRARNDASTSATAASSTSSPQTHYYLAQCPLWHMEASQVLLPQLYDDIDVPSFVEAYVEQCSPDVELIQANLWMCVSKTVAAAHYDANHGLLCVVSGSKT